MKKRLLAGLATVLIIGLAAIWFVPVLRFTLLGYLHHEPVYGAKPTSYWVHALEDEDATVRAHATFALGQIGPGAADAVPALTKELLDQDATVRSSWTDLAQRESRVRADPGVFILQSVNPIAGRLRLIEGLVVEIAQERKAKDRRKPDYGKADNQYDRQSCKQAVFHDFFPSLSGISSGQYSTRVQSLQSGRVDQ